MSRFNSLEFEDSFEDFERQSVQKDEAFYLTEAQAAFESARFEQALRYFGKVLEFNPGNAAAWTGQVRILIELKEFAEARLWAEKALERFPDEPELLAAKAVALCRMGDMQAALAFSDASIEERGDTPYVWLARGDVLLARREKRADYCFDKAMALAPASWFVRWLAARIYFFYKKTAIALKHAQEALNLNPSSAPVWLQVGNCQLALGLVNLAENSFTQAQQLDPRCDEAKTALNNLANTGFLSRAIASLRQLFH